MSGYLDKDFNPKPEFWSALWEGNTCHKCGYQMNGHHMIKDLLDGPIKAKCNKCLAEWSIAIPLGANDGRARIESLLAAEARFHVLRDELNSVIALLQNRD